MFHDTYTLRPHFKFGYLQICKFQDGQETRTPLAPLAPLALLAPLAPLVPLW